MRTTIDVNDALLQAVKTHAAREHQTLKQTFEQALRAYLTRPAPATTEAPPIPVFRGQGVQPGRGSDRQRSAPRQSWLQSPDTGEPDRGFAIYPWLRVRNLLDS